MANASESALKVYPVRFEPGDEIKSKLVTFVKENQLKSAFVMTCCGSVTKATLRMARPSVQRDGTERVKTFDQYFEILSLVGTLSQEGAHLHISLGDENGHVIGGHVMGDLVVYTTAEVVIGECTGITFKRDFDQRTGFGELKIETDK